MKLGIKSSLVAALMGLAASNANAVDFILNTGGQDVKASFTVAAGSITVTLYNFEANPTAVTDLISGIQFGVTGSTAGVAFTGGSATTVDVASNGTYVTGGPVATNTDWILSGAGTSTLLLSGLGANGPDGLIIGPAGAGNVYSNANGSIAGNNAHNPFFQSGATFIITGANITAQTTITSAAFIFGTNGNITENPPVPGNTPGVPDGGTTAILLGGALLGLAAARRFFAR